ncbi:hypothetical protein AGLY_001409 [Aphis glycines]|uniref:DUF4806 domain-containing protein n=1 Tax=Aphis glycines TaxID=307491 RepID=A0A6G0U629_APHGL|nr:hypothetical protein AGLY_001409 [Aphis glycines]
MADNLKTEVMGVTAFKPPPEINFSGNLSEVWKRWKQRYDLYVLATSTNTLPNEQQIAILLNIMGDQGIELYNTFNLSATVNVNEVIEQFEKYCNPHKNIVYERFKFFNAKQKPGQTIEEYIIELQTLSTSCEFMEKNNMCRDRLIVGLLDIGLQERLLKESNLTLEKAAEFCRTAEASRQQANTIQGQSSQTRTNAVEKVDAVKAKEEFQDEMFRSIDKLNDTLQGMHETFNILGKKFDVLITDQNLSECNSVIPNENVGENIETIEWPICTDDQLEIIETKLESDTTYEKLMVTEFRDLAEKNVIVSVRRIMKHMFCDKFLEKYSFVGFKNKRSFSNLRCCRLIFDSIKASDKRFQNIQNIKIEKVIRRWLVEAPLRAKKN